MTSSPTAPVSAKHSFLIYALLLLACIHCARSVFLVNISLLDLPGYEQGTERMPFQGRVALMPVLRWAHGSHAMQHAAAFFDRSLRNTPHMQNPPEPYSPEKLAVMLIAVLSTVTMTFAAVWYGRRRLGDLWWLPGVIVLATLYTTCAARYEMEFWYPYDFLHFALFGLACLCLLESNLLLFILFFLLDVPVRETSIFLVPVLLALGYGRKRFKQSLTLAAAMLLVWTPVHWLINRRFSGNASETSLHWLSMGRAIANPLHWPQIASAFAFLAIPLFLGRKHLTRDQRFLLLGAAPCLAVTALYGIWYESRIWDEWTLPFSIMLATEFAVLYNPLLKVAPSALSNLVP